MRKSVRTLLIPGLVGLGLVVGLLRELLLAYIYGTSREIEVFRLAFGLPSILSEALAISFVSVLIPVLLSDDDESSFRRAVWASSLMGGMVFLLGVITMPFQASLLAPGITGQDNVALITAGRVCWGMFLLGILSLPLRAFMSVNNRTWPGASSALFRSAGFTLALGTLLIIGEGRLAITAAYAALFAGFTVVIMHLLALGAAGRKELFKALGTGLLNTELRPLLLALTIVFGTQLLLSGGRIIDRAVASGRDEGTLAALEYSYALLMALAAFVGTSANIVLAPRIARACKEKGKIPAKYWKLIIGITSAATIIGITVAIFSLPMVTLVFEHGAFTSQDSEFVSRAVKWHLIALGPLVLALILTQVLILSGKQRWLVPLAAWKLLVKSLALWFFVEVGLDLEGIALSLGVAEVAVVFGIALVLMKHQNRRGISIVMESTNKKLSLD